MHRGSPRPAARLGALALSLLPALALASGLAGCGEARAGGRRPDVVMIVVDTLRNDRLSCYGHPRPTSPVLDALAAEGALFEDVTAQCPWTLPSMVSMFHGRYLTTYRDHLDRERASIATSFKRAGYRTVAVVSNRLVDEGQGFARGFDHFDARAVRVQEQPGEPPAVRNRDIDQLLADLEGPLAKAVAPDADGERPPLFLYLHAFDPHAPYFPHPELRGELPLDGGLPTLPLGWREAQLALHLPEPPGADWAAALAELDRERALYDQEVRHFDRGLGRLLELLEQHGVGARTVFALVSDHGEGLWDHRTARGVDLKPEGVPRTFFFGTHGGTGYQDQIATPFVLWGSGVPRGVRVAQAVENVDLYPTLLQLADIAPPAELHGRSVVPLLDGDEVAWREHVYSFGIHAVSVRELASGLKLIVPGPKLRDAGGAPELYDLDDDPLERTDLYAERPADAARLGAALQAWLAAHEDAGAGVQSAEQRAALLQKLAELGYTEAETGLPVGD